MSIPVLKKFKKGDKIIDITYNGKDYKVIPKALRLQWTTGSVTYTQTKNTRVARDQYNLSKNTVKTYLRSRKGTKENSLKHKPFQLFLFPEAIPNIKRARMEMEKCEF